MFAPTLASCTTWPVVLLQAQISAALPVMNSEPFIVAKLIGGDVEGYCSHDITYGTNNFLFITIIIHYLGAEADYDGQAAPCRSSIAVQGRLQGHAAEALDRTELEARFL